MAWTFLFLGEFGAGFGTIIDENNRKLLMGKRQFTLHTGLHPWRSGEKTSKSLALLNID
ncbi:MAG: hypothetical protein ACJAU6_003070 [Alphaproteobacteria bacterium]|jgi:hypothetical protein